MIKFQVIEHHAHHLDVLAEHVELHKGPFGRVKGLAEPSNLREAHDDNRLGPIDGHTDMPEKYLIIDTREG